MVGLSRYFWGWKGLARRIEWVSIFSGSWAARNALRDVRRSISHKSAPTKKPRTMPGLLYYRNLNARSVLRDHRATPVEAVDQRRADGLHDGLEVDVVENRQPRSVAQLANRNPLILGHAIFGLHEPAGAKHAKHVERVFNAAAHEPAVTIETFGMRTERGTRSGIDQGCARPVGTAVAAVDVGENVRRDEVADAHTGSPAGPQLFLTDGEGILVLDRTLDAAELAVTEDAGDPRSPELPIITGAYRAEVTPATLPLLNAEHANTGNGVRSEGVSFPEAIAATAEDVETGPIIDRCRWLIHGGLAGQIGCKSRTGKRRDRGQGDD